MTKYLDDITHVLASHEQGVLHKLQMVLRELLVNQGVVLCTSGSLLSMK